METAVGMTVGTPLYMSPEQARGEVLAPASDMFSFGLLMQALFTKQDPHPAGMSAREVMMRVARGETTRVEGVERDVTALINRLKQFAPADRPTAVEAVEKLQYFADKPQRIVRRAAAAALVALLAFGGWRYTVDLQRERAKAVLSEKEAVQRREHAENLIGFMLGDLSKKLEPVGRLDIMDDVAKATLAYVESINLETVSAEELVLNAKALNQLSEVRIAQAKYPEALELARHSLRLTEVASRRAPGNPEVQLAYGTSHFWIGDVHRRMQDIAAAMKHWQVYLDVATSLSRLFPANEEYRLERAYGHGNMAMLLETQGNFADALRHHEYTRTVKESRLAAQPADPARRADLAVTDNKIGFAMHRMGRVREARAHFEKELLAYRALASSDPKNAMWQEREARSHSYMALALESAGDLPGAIEHARAEIAIESRLAALDPTNASWQRNLVNSQARLGSLLFLSGDSNGALAAYDGAEATLERALSQEAHAKIRMRPRAMIDLGRARIQRARGNAAAARERLQAARRTLASRNEPATLLIAAEAELLAGDLLEGTGDEDGARGEWSAAEKRLAASPMAAEPVGLQMRAAALHRLGRSDEARQILDRLYATGYRHPEMMALRDQIAQQTVRSAM
jgi:tetratricopeptide (TPR) repeat protein